MYIDGGCVGTKAGNRAGFGVFWTEGDHRNEARALVGTEQTAQRAEVSPMVHALYKARTHIMIASDSRYTVDNTNNILTEEALGQECRHNDLWNQVLTTSTWSTTLTG